MFQVCIDIPTDTLETTPGWAVRALHQSIVTVLKVFVLQAQSGRAPYNYLEFITVLFLNTVPLENLQGICLNKSSYSQHVTQYSVGV